MHICRQRILKRCLYWSAPHFCDERRRKNRACITQNDTRDFRPSLSLSIALSPRPRPHVARARHSTWRSFGVALRCATVRLPTRTKTVRRTMRIRDCRGGCVRDRGAATATDAARARARRCCCCFRDDPTHHSYNCGCCRCGYCSNRDRMIASRRRRCVRRARARAAGAARNPAGA